MYTRDRLMHIKRLFYVATYFMHMKIGVLLGYGLQKVNAYINHS
jgi:hypothetical protein